MTTAQFVARIRTPRLNDAGDDTQTVTGTANPQYFWQTSDIIVAGNAAQYDLYGICIDTYKRNELKNLLATATSSPLPAGFYHPLSAQVNGMKAMLNNDPSNQLWLSNSTLYAVNIYGNVVITTPAATAFSVLYWKLPALFVDGDATDHQDFTPMFYEAILALTEYYLVYKDGAQVRTIMRRKFGEQDIQMIDVLDTINSMK